MSQVFMTSLENPHNFLFIIGFQALNCEDRVCHHALLPALFIILQPLDHGLHKFGGVRLSHPRSCFPSHFGFNTPHDMFVFMSPVTHGSQPFRNTLTVDHDSSSFPMGFTRNMIFQPIHALVQRFLIYPGIV